MARIRLGDIVPLSVPGHPGPDFVSPNLPPMIPALPTAPATAFFSTMEQGGIPGVSQGQPYASSVNSAPPPINSVVAGGPTFVPTQPGGGLPLTHGITRPGQKTPAFRRTPILPDATLPPALQRAGLLNRRPIYFYTDYDQALARDAQVWEWVRAHGGLKTCCRIPELGTPIYAYPPWQVMPSTGLRFQETFFQPLGSVSGGGPFNGLDTVLGEFRCEIGFDGVITHFLCGYTGNGFDDGSGNIIWRLKIGQRFAKTLGNVTFTFGSLQTALTIPGSGYRFISGQTVQLIANIPTGVSVLNGGRVFAGALGWTYPRR